MTVSFVTQQLPVKKNLGKNDPRPKTLEAETFPSRKRPPLETGITWLKRFRKKRLTAGPVEKACQK